MTSKVKIEREIGERFRLIAPTLVSNVGSCPPLTFSRLRSDAAGHGMTKVARAEDAYVVHVGLNATEGIQMWLNGREAAVPTVPKMGLIMCHLEAQPLVRFESPFDLLRFYIAKAAIDELSEPLFGRLSEGLRAPEYGVQDPILFHLASAIAPLLARQSSADQLLLDQLALGFHAHITRAYAGSPREIGSARRGGLPPWQERRAKEYLTADLSRPVSLLEVARDCGLSPSHFARAFRMTTGRPPHRWLIERRVEAAKLALEATDNPVAEIARSCGFSDASHFSRVFSKSTGESPAAWRRGRGRTSQRSDS